MIRALLGGSFDPVHNGHVAVANHLLDNGLADVVTVVPAAISPHKTMNHASAAERLSMVRLAFDPLADVAVDDRELARCGPSYTVDTLRELVTEFPDDQWWLVIGADNLDGLGSWHRWETVQSLARILVMARDDRAPVVPAAYDRRRFRVVADFREPVSSTAIRAMLARRQTPSGYVPVAVAEYIVRRHLYGL